MDWLGIDLRRLGTGLVVFGVTGMLIAGIVAVGLIGGAVAARNLDERLATEQAQLVAALDRVDATMAQTVTTVDNAGATLTTTSETLAQAAATLNRVASTAEELGSSLDFTILGNRPLAGAATKFGELAVEVRAFEDKASALADNLGVNATDVGGLATQIDLLRDEVSALAARVSAFEATGQLVGLLIGGILLLALLVAWLAVAGVGCAWVGLRLRRLGSSAGGAAPAGTVDRTASSS